MKRTPLIPLLRKHALSLIVGALALGIFATLASCGSKSDSTTTTSSTFTSVYSAMTTANCMSCHKPGGSATSNNVSLDFTTQANAYSGLTTSTVSGTVASACNGAHLVVASDPSSSYVLGALFSSYSTSTYGLSGCTPSYSTHSSLGLTDTDKSTFVSWISGGAQNN